MWGYQQYLHRHGAYAPWNTDVEVVGDKRNSSVLWWARCSVNSLSGLDCIRLSAQMKCHTPWFETWKYNGRFREAWCGTDIVNMQIDWFWVC